VRSENNGNTAAAEQPRRTQKTPRYVSNGMSIHATKDIIQDDDALSRIYGTRKSLLFVDQYRSEKSVGSISTHDSLLLSTAEVEPLTPHDSLVALFQGLQVRVECTSRSHSLVPFCIIMRHT
jgi:hypothetical protein